MSIMDASPPVDILVIEDDADARANLRDILELDDHRVATAGSAAEALGRDDWARFAAIILDRRLPDATAEQLLPRLKAAAPDAAVIVVTGYADLQGAIAALAPGGDRLHPQAAQPRRAPGQPAAGSPSGGGSRWPRSGARPRSATWSRPPSA